MPGAPLEPMLMAPKTRVEPPSIIRTGNASAVGAQILVIAARTAPAAAMAVDPTGRDVHSSRVEAVVDLGGIDRAEAHDDPVADEQVAERARPGDHVDPRAALDQDRTHRWFVSRR